MHDYYIGVAIPPHVGVGIDGRLLLVGGAHNVRATFAVNAPAISKEVVRSFIGNVEHRESWSRDRGYNFSQWVFPDPITFVGALGPGEVSSIVNRYVPDIIKRKYLNYPLGVIDGRPERQSRTDTHYGSIGNLHMAAHISDTAIGVRDAEMVDDLEKNANLTVGVSGDLGKVCLPPIKEDRLSVKRVSGIVEAGNGFVQGNNGVIHLMISPNSKTDRKLLIFGDSFFRLMMSELARYWRSIVFVRSKFFHYEAVRAVSPDDIMCGMAERYFPTSQSDRERPHFLAYPLINGKAMNPDPDFPRLWGELVDSRALATP